MQKFLVVIVLISLIILRFSFFQTLPISDMFLQFSLFHSRRDIKCVRESILKATHRLPHVSFLKREVEKKKRKKEYRAVKRTNLPSTRSVESLVAIYLFPNFFFFVILRVQ